MVVVVVVVAGVMSLCGVVFVAAFNLKSIEALNGILAPL